MEKMVKCKACGQEIAKSARTCPNCGAKQKTPLGVKIVSALIVLFVFMVIAAAVGSKDNKPKKVESGQNPSASQGTNQDVPPSEDQSTFGVGDKVEYNGVYVTLNSVEELSGGEFFAPEEGKVYVSCEFTIENESKDELNISSIMCFDAYVDDIATDMSMGASMAAEAGGLDGLDGAIAAGKKMHGVIGYEVPKDWSEIEVHFNPDAWGGKDFVFAYKK